jgi:hypothetical protein
MYLGLYFTAGMEVAQVLMPEICRCRLGKLFWLAMHETIYNKIVDLLLHKYMIVSQVMLQVMPYLKLN